MSGEPHKMGASPSFHPSIAWPVGAAGCRRGAARPFARPLPRLARSAIAQDGGSGSGIRQGEASLLFSRASLDAGRGAGGGRRRRRRRRRAIRVKKLLYPITMVMEPFLLRLRPRAILLGPIHHKMLLVGF